MNKQTAKSTQKAAKPLKTHGLSHLSLAVHDPERSLKFYKTVFGVKEYYRDADSIQVLGPGRKDVLAFEKDHILAGKGGGLTHFGFRLTKPGDIDTAVALVQLAGGRVLSRGEFTPDSPYAFILDPDGYEIEIWYE